jgi:hypothetical protein
MRRDLRTFDELDRDGEPIDDALSANDEAESAGTEFLAEVVGGGEERVEVVMLESATGDGGRLGRRGCGCRGVEKVHGGKESRVLLVRRSERRRQRHCRRLKTLALALLRLESRGRRHGEGERGDGSAKAGRKRRSRHGRRGESVDHAFVLSQRRCR